MNDAKSHACSCTHEQEPRRVHALNLNRGQCHMDLRPVIEDPRASGNSPPLVQAIYALPGRP